MSRNSNVSNLPRAEGGPEDHSSGPTFRRTRKGSEELVLRKHGLSEEQRKILLFANGNRSIEELARLIPEIHESTSMLAAMEELGFLAMHDPEIGDPSPTGRQAENSGAGHHPADGPSSTAAAANTPESLGQTKSRVKNAIASVMGAEGAGALERIDGVTSAAELRQLIAKISKLIELYAGDRRREEFLREFDSFLKS